MSCRCLNTEKQSETIKQRTERMNAEISEEMNARPTDIPEGVSQCFECTKKHLSRAKIFFEEYHTGYPTYIKLAVNSAVWAEKAISEAYLMWCSVTGHLDMAGCELLGHDINIKLMPIRDRLKDLANKIRAERVKLMDDPLYIPDIDALLIEVQHCKVIASGLPDIVHRLSALNRTDQEPV